MSALQSKVPCTAGELFLFPVVQPKSHHCGVGHDRGGNRSGGLSGSEQLVPHGHDGEERLYTNLGRTRDQPTNHLSPSPVHARLCQAHHLEPQLEGDVEESRVASTFAWHRVSERILGELEQVGRGVHVPLHGLEHSGQLGEGVLGSDYQGGCKCRLLVLDVAQGEPPGEPAQHQSSSTSLLVRVLVLVQDGQPKALSTHSEKKQSSGIVLILRRVLVCYPPEGEIDVVGKSSKKKKFCKSMNRTRLRVNTVPKGR